MSSLYWTVIQGTSSYANQYRLHTEPHGKLQAHRKFCFTGKLIHIMLSLLFFTFKRQNIYNTSNVTIIIISFTNYALWHVRNPNYFWNCESVTNLVRLRWRGISPTHGLWLDRTARYRNTRAKYPCMFSSVSRNGRVSNSEHGRAQCNLFICLLRN